MAQFSNVIVHGTINSAQGDLHINNRDSEVGLHTLRLGVSLGAIHDSAERYPPPNCHPDTRTAVRQIILDWIHDESSASPFFWLYGPAGAGKTAILQAIAEFLCSPSRSDENFGGSFFFSRGKNGRDQGQFLFSTIAYQLALKVPGLRQHVNRIMEANPTLHTKSMAVQLQNLIVDSLQSLSPLPQCSYLVIIDGLDECHDKAIQQSILQLLCETIALHKLPLRFLIGSRPESHIRASFDQKSLYTITRRVVLDGNFNPGRDIQVFLEDGFAKICAQSSILSHVEQPWPGRGIIDLLVQRSSGQFIYAATVLKFVGADFCSPTKQLALILKPDSTAFSDLDQLYTQILSVYPKTVNIVQVLGIIVAFEIGALTSGVIEDILGMEKGEVKVVLQGLSSLIAFVGDVNGEYLTGKVVSNVGRPYFLHASFGDFLMDSSRSGPFHVDKQTYTNQGTIWSFSLITKSIANSWSITPPTRVRHGETWQYFDSYLTTYFMRSPQAVKEAIMTDIADLVQEFWKISSDGAVDVSFTAMFHLLEILRKLANSRWDFAWQFDDFCGVFDGYQKMLDQSFIFAFSESRDMGDLLRFLPGIVVQKGLTMQGMADLYRVNMDLLERIIVSNIELLSPFDVHSHSRHTLADYLASFLQDRARSQLYYCDPILHHIFICRHILALLGSNASDLELQSYDELTKYIQFYFYNHLFAATENFLSAQSVPADHPAVQILNGLESIAYCYVDGSWPGYLVRCCASDVLRWADTFIGRLKGISVSSSKIDLIQRVSQLTHKIYREILYIGVDQSMTIVSLVEFTPKFNRDTVRTLRDWTVIQLSWQLLCFVSVEGRILSSFTDFITTPEISGPLYISPDVYHTQITEYCLETLSQHNINFPASHFIVGEDRHLPLDCSFKEHISRALPTDMVFYLLRSIPIHLFIWNNTAETIIKWLEGLGSERPTDLYDRFSSQITVDSYSLNLGPMRFERIGIT